MTTPTAVRLTATSEFEQAAFYRLAFSGRRFLVLLLESWFRRVMSMCARKNTASRRGWLAGPGLRAITVLVFSIFALLAVPSSFALGRHGGRSGFGFGQRGGGQHGGHPSAPQAHASPPHAQQPPRSEPEVRAYTPPHANTQARPGQQHLPEWLNSHRNMTPQQQEDALRREPGFRDLSPGQQQRLVNRLHALDQMTPEQRQRTVQRNENFERLSPERKQEIRGASQAFSQMSPDRQRAVRHAFQQLIQMPPQQRQQMLNSGAYAERFSPQERTVLGNLLSIEPYQRPNTIPQPYFGR